VSRARDAGSGGRARGLWRASAGRGARARKRAHCRHRGGGDPRGLVARERGQELASWTTILVCCSRATGPGGNRDGEWVVVRADAMARDFVRRVVDSCAARVVPRGRVSAGRGKARGAGRAAAAAAAVRCPHSDGA
jgi:hypothetical protein